MHSVHCKIPELIYPTHSLHLSGRQVFDYFLLQPYTPKMIILVFRFQKSKRYEKYSFVPYSS